MSVSNRSPVENEYQRNGPLPLPPRPRNISIPTAIDQGSVRRLNVVDLRIPKRKGISWAEFVFQIFVTNEGPTFFILPAMFKNIGYLPGTLGSLGIAIFYSYTMWILSWCDDYIQKKRRLKQQSLYSLVTNTFEEYKCPRIGSCLNFYLKYEIVLSWTMVLSFYSFFANKNVQLILAYFKIETSNQFVSLCLSVPIMFICWLPHIRAIVRLSYFIILTVTAVMIEVLYYILINPTQNPRVLMINDVSEIPTALFGVASVVIFTPLIFPLKLEMKYPSNLRKIFGGINLSIFLIVVSSVSFSLVAYFKLGDQVKENILENLPNNEVVLVTNCLFVVSLIGAQALIFFMIFQTLWYDGWENYFKKSGYVKFYEYVVRSIMGLFIIFLATVIPTVSLFINLISCFSYPYDSVLLPLILESVIVWNDRQNTTTTVLILIKNISISVLCVLASSVAFYESLNEILSFYKV